MSSDEILGLHPLLGERVRLAIMVALASSKTPIAFTQLHQSLDVTKGNLSSHLKKLEDEKLIKTEKQFVDRKPLSTYQCTAKGAKEVNNYLETMEQTLKVLRNNRE